MGLTLDWVTQPISEDLPCGPDLEVAEDEAFIDYYFEAEGRLPERYFVPGMRSDREQLSDDKVFDPASIDLKAERGEIEPLLRRSRDLRLLSLLARFNVLAGNTGGFADALDAMAGVLEAFPDAVHPLIDTRASDRRAAVEMLTSPVTVIFPLHYLPLNGQRAVSYRRWLVANAKAEPRKGEEDATPAMILDGLREASSARVVAQIQGDLTRAASALTRIARALKSHPRKPVNIGLDVTLEALAEVQGVIASARPDLPAFAAQAIFDAPTTPNISPDAPGLIQPPSGGGGSAGAAAAQPGPVVKSLAEGRATLKAVEVYLATNEPSSAALLLITQARLLIGKPLVEALETLLPGDASKAVIDFGPATGFSISMERLRSLSAELDTIRGPQSTLPDPQPPRITTRDDVAGHLRGVENWYRRNEPTSPIPILLVRARTYLDKDFEAIVAELLPIAVKGA